MYTSKGIDIDTSDTDVKIRDLMGYKVTFCKKLIDLRNPVDGRRFPYRTFGHFDGFIVKDAYSITDFEVNRDENISILSKNVSSSPDQGSLSNLDLFHCEKQTLNLLIPPPDVFSDVESVCNQKTFSYAKANIFDESLDATKQIVVFSIVNSYMEDLSIIQGNYKIDHYCKIICKENNKVELSYCIYKTFSIEDYVIVFRSNSVQSVFRVLKMIREDDDLKPANVYSVIGLSRGDGAHIIPEHLYANVRMYIHPKANYETIRAELSADDIIKQNSGVSLLNVQTSRNKDSETLPYFFSSMGRYDLVASYQFTNINTFLSLFDILNPGMQSNNETYHYILYTETTIMNRIDDNPYRIPPEPVDEPSSISCADWIDQYKKSRDESKDIWIEQEYKAQNLANKGSNSARKELQSEIERKADKKWGKTLDNAAYLLIERIHQLHHAVSAHKYAEDLTDMAKKFTLDIPKFIGSKELKISTEAACTFIGHMIGNIDDLFSMSFRDFEYSQKDGMYVHSFGKLLWCLRSYIQCEIWQTVKVYRKLVPKAVIPKQAYNTVVISDGGNIGKVELPGLLGRVLETTLDPNSITAGISSYSIVEIPQKALTKLCSTLFALSHEAGHYIKFDKHIIIRLAELAASMLGTSLCCDLDQNKHPVENKFYSRYERIKREGLYNTNTSPKTSKSNKFDLTIEELNELKDTKDYFSKFLHEYIADVFAIYNTGIMTEFDSLAKSNLSSTEINTSKKELLEKFIQSITDNVPTAEEGMNHLYLRIAALKYTFIHNYEQHDQYCGVFGKDGNTDILYRCYSSLHSKYKKDWAQRRSDKEVREGTNITIGSVIGYEFYHSKLRTVLEQIYAPQKNVLDRSVTVKKEDAKDIEKLSDVQKRQEILRQHDKWKRTYLLSKNPESLEFVYQFLEHYKTIGDNSRRI
jgi:hypothetical protein